MNPVKVKKIEDRIDELFPEENFYFFKIFEGDNQSTIEKNKLEQRQLLRLIKDCMSSNMYYIKKGLFEPIHYTVQERNQLVDGMQTSIAKIVSEVLKSAEICEKTFGIISMDLKEKLEKTKEFYNKFSILLNEKPFVL